jgi:YD repeat-containing protein
MAYDLAGKRTNLLVVTPVNAITTASRFDGLDRLSNVVCSTLGKSLSGAYAHNENGKVASMHASASGPGPALTYSYDSENRLSAISGKCGPPTVLSLAYAYNSAQQITNIAERLSDSTNTHAYSYDDRDQLAGEKIPEVTSGYDVSYSYDFAQNRLSKQNGTQPTDTFSYAIANKMTNMKSVLGFHHAPSRSTSTGIRFLVLHGRLVKQSRNGAELSACVRTAAHPRLRGGTAPKPGCCERSIVAAISHLTTNTQNGIITPPVR